MSATNLEPLENAIFTVNCLYEIQVSHSFSFYAKVALNMFSFTFEQIHNLDELIEAQIDVLVKEQYASILKQSGLASLIQGVDINKKAGVSLATDEKTNITAIRSAMQHLDTFLASMSSDVTLTLSRIMSAKVVKQISKRGLRRFAETYRKLYDDLMDPAHSYHGTLSLRKVSEVETLLSIET